MSLKAILVVTVSCVLLAPAAFAQFSCANADKSLSVYAADAGVAGLNAETSRDMDPCPYEVKVEAWFSSVASPVWSNRAVMNAALSERWGHPCGQRAKADSKHWLIKFGVDWDYLGGLHSEADIGCGGGGGGGPENNTECGSTCNDNCSCSPILVDVQRNGYRLTNAADGVQFDLNGDGTPEQVAWTLPDSDDAWLAMDRNGNGQIDNGKELFGEYTPAHSGGDRRAANGFQALLFTEEPDYGTSYADGIIDDRDAVWNRLVFWTDRNHNGISEPDELTSVGSTDVRGFETDYKELWRRDQHGNVYRLKGLALHGPQLLPQKIYDIWLKVE